MDRLTLNVGVLFVGHVLDDEMIENHLLLALLEDLFLDRVLDHAITEETKISLGSYGKFSMEKVTQRTT
jgi:hypothetical protein